LSNPIFAEISAENVYEIGSNPSQTRPKNEPEMAPACPRQIQLGFTLWRQAAQYFLEDLEQAHVRGMNRRSLRLKLIAGLVIALLMPALAVVAAHAQTATTTALTAQSSVAATCSLTSLAVSVTSTAGVPVGTVTIEDNAVSLASATLNSSGQANFQFALANGAHSLSAVYATGDASTFKDSASTPPVSVSISNQCDSAFVVTVSNLTPTSAANTMTLTPGQTGTGTISVVPLQPLVSTPTATPQFVTLSCSGLPDEASCTFTPAEVEILPNSASPLTSSMVIGTEAASGAFTSPATRPGQGSSPIAWAFLFPGAIGLGGLAWGARRRRWLSRLSLVALVGLVTLLGTTACNPRYSYLNHGPQPNAATPAGTYNVTVTAQSTNGVTATTQSTSVVLTVK
jgi:hypothetical protein